jgi:hypothetical protein
VTIAKRPSLWAGMARDVEVIWVKKEQEYFCEGGWTGVSVICRDEKINRPMGTTSTRQVS